MNTAERQQLAHDVAEMLLERNPSIIEGVSVLTLVAGYLLAMVPDDCDRALIERQAEDMMQASMRAAIGDVRQAK